MLDELARQVTCNSYSALSKFKNPGGNRSGVSDYFHLGWFPAGLYFVYGSCLSPRPCLLVRYSPDTQQRKRLSLAVWLDGRDNDHMDRHAMHQWLLGHTLFLSAL